MPGMAPASMPHCKARCSFSTMAVRVLPHAHLTPAARVMGLPAVVLAVALVPTALDLLRIVQPALAQVLVGPTGLAAAAAAAVLVFIWLRSPRTAWLTGAAFAACASLGLRLAGAELAPLLSVVSIVALGLSGAFR